MVLVPLGDGAGASAWVVTAPDGRDVAVFRLDDGSLRAVQAACPHRAGPLAEGRLLQAGDGAADATIMCPSHWYRFSLETGRNMTMPGDGLACYPVVDHDGVPHAELPPPPVPSSWSERLRAHARGDV
ncbi:MAG TPA: Rieske (2Fe-2S) protein [Actinomycetospora sp.]|jgi:nitrite reductase/ring-hydroxylating ferredoxin subunit|uniref:Rieske (2Fe-2S) protein n=1 Tax=Actinomycetospora sp. TaxID=1872135 RepID=UPI002F4162A9